VLLQVAGPQRLYDEPDNLFVAGFIGSPAMNLVEATVHANGTAMSIDVGSQVLVLHPELVAERPALRNYIGDRVAMGVRSEDLHDVTEETDWPADRRLVTEVVLTEALGSEAVVHFTVDARRVMAEGTSSEEAPDDLLSGAGRTPFVARFPARTRAWAGDRIDVGVDTNRLHFFDLDSGLAIRA
jgi:multiple sugar transport system ATP-binding protein